VLERQLPGFRVLQSCEQLTAGASQETYRLTLRLDSGERHLALRRMQPNLTQASSVGTILPDTEARLFQLATAAGIPGPGVVYVLQPSDGLGNGFLMDWLEGETLGQRIVRSEALAEVRPRLARQCGEILGRIHKLDWRSAGLGAVLPTVDPGTLVDDTWAHYRDLNVPVPMIDFAWRWLKAHLPEQPRTTLVHGDFRNGNLMVAPDGINAVLDWELAHIGDPVRDLGWLCVNSWRFGVSAMPVGGFGAIEDLLAGYQHTSGVSVTREELVFWQVFGSFWWAMATLQMASTWRTGETPSLERPVIGRRSSEAQMDCVNLLIPGDYSLPPAGHSIAAGSQLPTPAELLEGVRSFLKDDIAMQLDSHAGFLARVAANSLGIAQREMLHGSALAVAERERLERVLGITGDLDELRWELVRRLRDDLPLDTPGLAQHLRQTVAGQLALDQPGYSALRQA
jgi:aminoglycoside phosphotransferase (APT) family kinase protein